VGPIDVTKNLNSVHFEQVWGGGGEALYGEAELMKKCKEICRSWEMKPALLLNTVGKHVGSEHEDCSSLRCL